ncbi:MAG TPA: hypothetical protein ENI64_03500 [Gammaproteobacteria bacterium]|nr:hypothetical protein [Gammaproteobacteria bacterium]
MSSLFTSILVFTAEAGVVLMILFAVYGFLYLKRRKHDRHITQNLVKDFREELPDRRDQLHTILAESSVEMDGEKAEEKVNYILNKEKSIYLHAIQAFSGKHRSMLRKINEDVGELGGAYRNLVAYLNENSASAEQLQELNDKIEQLEQLNSTVQKELDDTNVELERIMSEYTALYARFKDEI